jgi:hypothetical protein
MIRILAFLAVVGLVSVAPAADMAATADLPEALQALGATNAVVTETAAHEVRGQWTHESWQTKDFTIREGIAVGSTNLLEGVFGTFTYASFADGDDSGYSLQVEGTFGGLIGTISGSKDGLDFNMAGKAFQETFDFTGKFSQNFEQYFAAPLP